MIETLLGSSGRGFRQALAARLERHPDIRVVAATGKLDRLRALAARSRSPMVVLDSCWVQSSPELIGHLTAGPTPSTIVVFADNLATPEVRAAVQQGVNGCVRRDALTETWHKAILAIDAGDTWVPRWVMSEALADLMRRLPPGHPALVDLERLTERQREIAFFVSMGLSNKKIGQRLGISPTTVKTHLQNIFHRLGIHGRQQLARQEFTPGTDRRAQAGPASSRASPAVPESRRPQIGAERLSLIGGVPSAQKGTPGSDPDRI